MADLTQGETVAAGAGIVGLVTSIGVSLAGALRWNSRMDKLEAAQKESDERLDKLDKKLDDFASDLKDLKDSARTSMVDLQPAIKIAVGEAMHSMSERILELRETVAEVRGTIRGAPTTRRRP
jgi:chromosome segregation ATPase